MSARWIRSAADPENHAGIRVALEVLVSEPETGKVLRDELTGLRSYRLGRLQIIYRLQKPGLIDIAAIGPRKTIYEDTFRLLKRETEK